ncbi:8977_t:CDS:2 [Entrophospora sp. SA101]|nr:8977_t:CDS:2 [Entrophospora sp. SA101]
MTQENENTLRMLEDLLNEQIDRTEQSIRSRWCSDTHVSESDGK